MEEKQFLENLAQQFDETDPKEISLETNFKQLDEWGSLIALSIMAMTDIEYGVKLTPEDFKSSETLAEIFEIIKSRL